jgi:hypothetical protein
MTKPGPRTQRWRMAAVPVSPEGQQNFNPDHLGPDGCLEGFYLNGAESNQTYYAVVYARSGSETLFSKRS